MKQTLLEAIRRIRNILRTRQISKDVLLSRNEKVFFLLNKTGQGLEIGPSHNPIAPKREGFRVHILDHLDADGLKKKYSSHGVNVDAIEEVDFVWQGEKLSELIGSVDCYDWIIASHVIEHYPDIVSFLRECEKLLKPMGVLSLVVPDKRACFDYFSPISSTGEILDSYFQKRTRPSPGQVFNHFANASKKNGAIAWALSSGSPNDLVHDFPQTLSLLERAKATEEYIDVHCWRFTPQVFANLLADLNNIGLVGLRLVRAFPTSGCEFYVSLQKVVSDPDVRSQESKVERLMRLHSACREVTATSTTS